jgi:hypothetical protein
VVWKAFNHGGGQRPSARQAPFHLQIQPRVTNLLILCARAEIMSRGVGSLRLTTADAPSLVRTAKFAL